MKSHEYSHWNKESPNVSHRICPRRKGDFMTFFLQMSPSPILLCITQHDILLSPDHILNRPLPDFF